ncbi:MAG: hypothetical protein ACLS4Z_07120 [Christensenellaceae bacterium]
MRILSLTADGEPAAGMAIVEQEPDYDKIYGGAWLTVKAGNISPFIASA